MLVGLLVDKCSGAGKGQRFKVVGLLHRHGWVCWLCGRLVGGAWCGSLPSCDYPYPISRGTVAEILGSGATISGDPWIWFLQDNGEVGDANGSGVAHLDGRAWLRPTRFDEGLTEGDHFFGGGVEIAKFSFGGRRHDKFIIWEIERTGPLCLGKGLFLETMM